MRQWGLTLGALAALALAGCGEGSGNSTGGDAVSTAAQAAVQAAGKFQTLAQGSAASGQVPRATDATAGPLLDTVFNTSTVTPTTPMTDAQLDGVNNWLLAVNNVGIAYMLAGTGQSSVATVTPAMNTQVGHNLDTYAPELGRYFDTELVLLGAEAVTVAQEIASDPGRLSNATAADGVAKMRAGVAQTAGGVINTIAPGGGPPDAWREARGKALVAFAPNAAKLLTPDARTTLASQANAAAAQQTDAALKGELSQFATLIAPTS